eukprot:5638255-Pleurochrysis_carterae.AAC.1
MAIAMASRSGCMQSPSVRCDVQVYGWTRFKTVRLVHRLTRIVMARLGHGLRSLLRRACGFDVRSSRACAFRGTAVKQSSFRA